MDSGKWIVLDGPLDAAVEKFKEAMKAAGFGTLVDIDVQALLKEKIGAEVEGYRLLGVCSPHLAHDATRKAPDLGLLLPCGAMARELPDGRVRMGVVDPSAMIGLLDPSEADSLGREMEEAKGLLFAALDGLS